MFQGHQPMLILGALANQDRTAMEIIDAVKKDTKGKTKLSQAGIYSQLHRLESQGLIKGYYGKDLPVERGGRPRRYYKIMAAGRHVLDQVDQVRGLGVQHG